MQSAIGYLGADYLSADINTQVCEHTSRDNSTVAFIRWSAVPMLDQNWCWINLENFALYFQNSGHWDTQRGGGSEWLYKTCGSLLVFYMVSLPLLLHVTAELTSAVGLEDADDYSRCQCDAVYALEGFGECSSQTRSQLKFSATCQLISLSGVWCLGKYIAKPKWLCSVDSMQLGVTPPYPICHILFKIFLLYVIS